MKQCWNGISHLHKIWKALKNTTGRDDMAIRSTHGLWFGLFQFMLSMVPRKLKWLTETIGFKGNRAKGINHIEKAAELKDFRGRFARICLL